MLANAGRSLTTCPECVRAPAREEGAWQPLGLVPADPLPLQGGLISLGSGGLLPEKSRVRGLVSNTEGQPGRGGSCTRAGPHELVAADAKGSPHVRSSPRGLLTQRPLSMLDRPRTICKPSLSPRVSSASWSLRGRPALRPARVMPAAETLGHSCLTSLPKAPCPPASLLAPAGCSCFPKEQEFPPPPRAEAEGGGLVGACLPSCAGLACVGAVSL